MHPFDLSSDDLEELQKIFPMSTTAGKRMQHRGIEISALKEHLKTKIQISEDRLDTVLKKIDHKCNHMITWTEFLQFLTNEGLRRETVNDAQLYGLGVKRLIEKDRITVAANKDASLNEKAVEYFIDRVVFLTSNNFALSLIMMENNQALLYDCRTFQVIQELAFPSDYATAKVRPNSNYRT